MSLFRTKETKVMIIIFGLFIQQLTNPGLSSYVKIELFSYVYDAQHPVEFP
jgi:hypothetical protein